MQFLYKTNQASKSCCQTSHYPFWIVCLMCALTLSNCAQQPSNESPANPLKQVSQVVDHATQDSVPETEPDTLSQRFTISGNNLPIELS